MHRTYPIANFRSESLDFEPDAGAGQKPNLQPKSSYGIGSKYNIAFSVVPAILILISGCATTTPVMPIPQQQAAVLMPAHTIQKGETLWRVSKIYNVDLNELIKVNGISDYTKIETGQKIIIPSTAASSVRLPQRHESASGGSYLSRGEKVKGGGYSSEDFSWPLKGQIITNYGQVVNNMVNKGINIAAGFGSNVSASRSGRVVFYSTDFNDFGKTIIIDHGDGYLTVYARNSEVLVKKGDFIQKGLVVARVGAAGRDKNPYLHFEIRKKHLAQNPNFYLP